MDIKFLEQELQLWAHAGLNDPSVPKLRRHRPVVAPGNLGRGATGRKNRNGKQLSLFEV